MDLSELQLEKRLKNWAACRRPPPGGKARLLRAASSQTYGFSKRSASERLTDNKKFSKGLQNRSGDSFHGFFDWSIVFTLEVSMVNLRLRL
jgi:hypothetical protein